MRAASLAVVVLLVATAAVLAAPALAVRVEQAPPPTPPHMGLIPAAPVVRPPPVPGVPAQAPAQPIGMVLPANSVLFNAANLAPQVPAAAPAAAPAASAAAAAPSSTSAGAAAAPVLSSDANAAATAPRSDTVLRVGLLSSTSVKQIVAAAAAAPAPAPTAAAPTATAPTATAPAPVTANAPGVVPVSTPATPPPPAPPAPATPPPPPAMPAFPLNSPTVQETLQNGIPMPALALNPGLVRSAITDNRDAGAPLGAFPVNIMTGTRVLGVDPDPLGTDPANKTNTQMPGMPSPPPVPTGTCCIPGVGEVNCTNPCGRTRTVQDDIELSLDAVKTDIVRFAQKVQSDNDWVKQVRKIMRHYHDKVQRVEANITQLKDHIRELFAKKKHFEDLMLQSQLDPDEFNKVWKRLKVMDNLDAKVKIVDKDGRPVDEARERLVQPLIM